LLPVDETLLRDRVPYVRYVDDIRIFAGTQLEAQKASVRLEVLCRNLGLIPQGGKTAIKEAKNVQDVLGILPSLAAPDRTEAEGPPTLERDKAERIFVEAIGGRPYRIVDKSKARYVLFRAPHSRRLLDLVLRLLPRHPEHIDAFVYYLDNYTVGRQIERAIVDLLRRGTPYEFVRGELWHVLARIAKADTRRRMMRIAKDDLRDASTLILKWGAMNFLLSCQRAGLGSHARRLKHQHELVQALLVPAIPDSEYGRGGLVGWLLREGAPDPGAVLAEQLIVRKQTHRDYGLRIRDLHPQLQNVFRAVGIVRRRQATRLDEISIILNRRYEVPDRRLWPLVLGREYAHALRILLRADSLYDASRSDWLQLQDSFNDTVVRGLIEFLNTAGLPGGRSLIDRKGELIRYGVLLDRGGPFAKQYPDIADALRGAHDRRNTLPGSHPFQQKGGAQNTFLGRGKQSQIHGALKAAYGEIVDLVDRNTP
jgi:hypothetical protein